MSQHDTHGSGGQYEVDEHAAGDDDAPEGVSLEQTAEIEAYLAVFVDEPRDAVLGRFDMDEDRFCNAKKVWAERIEDEVLRASAPGQRIAAAEKYRLSMRYSVAYSKAAERAREDAATVHGDGELETASASLGSGGMLRLGSGHE